MVVPLLLLACNETAPSRPARACLRAVALVTASALFASLLILAVTAGEAAAAGCSSFDVSDVDEISVPVVVDDDGRGQQIEEIVGDEGFVHERITSEKTPAATSGSHVALLIDRARVYDTDERRPIGESGALSAWSCSARGTFRCTGTLIHPEWVMTAAHCVSSVVTKVGERNRLSHPDIHLFHLMARTGSTNATEGGNLTSVVETWVHPEWAAQVFDDGTWKGNWVDMSEDIALLRLAEPVHLDTAAIATTPDGDELVETPLVSAGWGMTASGSTPHLHRWVPTMDAGPLCSESLHGGAFDGKVMVCADERDGSGTCLGDSGAPLGRHDGDGRYWVVAVTSFVLFPEDGFSCGQARLAVFTQIDEDHLEWMRNLIEPEAPDAES